MPFKSRLATNELLRIERCIRFRDHVADAERTIKLVQRRHPETGVSGGAQSDLIVNLADCAETTVQAVAIAIGERGRQRRVSGSAVELVARAIKKLPAIEAHTTDQRGDGRNLPGVLGKSADKHLLSASSAKAGK